MNPADYLVALVLNNYQGKKTTISYTNPVDVYNTNIWSRASGKKLYFPSGLDIYRALDILKDMGIYATTNNNKIIVDPTLKGI